MRCENTSLFRFISFLSYLPLKNQSFYTVKHREFCKMRTVDQPHRIFQVDEAHRQRVDELDTYPVQLYNKKSKDLQQDNRTVTVTGQ